jgi:hypothetical protein
VTIYWWGSSTVLNYEPWIEWSWASLAK